ncbi:MAG: NAD(P)H-binding protein [Acidimicrobiia bacterium]|nr:NAD(P)H-binding protein [Acidimicrobiia bacterium]
MRLTIFAATGGIGGHLVEQGLEEGHEITAAVRNPDKLRHHVPAVTVDLEHPDPGAMEVAIKDSDAVLSALGPRAKHEWGIVTRGTKSIVDAMEKTDVRRLLVVSGAGISVVPTPTRPNPPKREPGAGVLNRYFNTPLAKLVLGEHFVDVAMMEDVLRSSGLDWTAVRAPLLTDQPLTGTYRTAFGHNVPNSFRCARADVAHFMLRALEMPETIGQAVAVAY